MKQEKCIICEGEGKYKGKQCHGCDGRGIVFVPYETYFPYFEYKPYIPQPDLDLQQRFYYRYEDMGTTIDNRGLRIEPWYCDNA